MAYLYTVQLRLWDFSGQTRLFFLNDENKFLKESQKQPEQDVSCSPIDIASRDNGLFLKGYPSLFLIDSAV